MRNTLPLLSRPTDAPSHPSDVPSIHLVAATPSASGFSSEASTSLEFSWTAVPSVPSPLAPKTDAEPRKRLVPKKSKLGLLGGSSKDRQKDRGKDLSDVVRRVGGGSTSRRAGGFEIYVDPTDPEIGEIVMVKKKKSRAGLDGLRWGSGGGALGEVTNVPSVPQPMTAVTKIKTEEKEKWWTLGRGRKDSKEKEKEKAREKSETRPQPPRSKTPEPFKSVPETQSRARFNSLDSGMLLSSIASPPLNSADYSRNTSTFLLSDRQRTTHPLNEERQAPGTYSRSATPTFGGLLAPPTQFDGLDPSQGNPNQNSIALRAMRSIARIGSWAQLKNGTGPGDETFPKELEKKGKPKSKEKEETKKKSKKDKSEKEDRNKTQRIRNSTSSFEAGALTTSPEVKALLGKKKRSILGLGLPSTMRLPAVRSGSTTSSIGATGGSDNNRLSVDSAVAIAARMRSGSTMSTGSSLRPMSTTSSTSCISSGSSAASVRWDEAGLETVKELRRKEKETKRQSIEDAEADAKRKKANHESRRHSEGRRRTPITDVFPDAQEGLPGPAAFVRTVSDGAPLLTLEEATSDGHERMSEDELSTPMKCARPRPLSEQLMGRRRPQGIHEEDGEGVISILSAATNDLAQLINHLDLEATPGATPGKSPDASPWRRTAGFQSSDTNQDSPTKKTLRGTMTSISSLRPYAQYRELTTAKPANSQDLLDQQIAPWPVLNSYLPQKEVPAKEASSVTTSKVRGMHKRTMSPSGYLPEASPPPPLRPLRPAKSRNVVALFNLQPLGPPPSIDLPVQPLSPVNAGRAPSSLTFGSRSSSRAGESSISSLNDIHSRNPVFRPTHGHNRNRSSLLSSQPGGGSQGSIPEENFTTSRPLSVEARRQLGMKGTMGGSDVSAYAVDDLDTSDPDSDIPDELQVILANQSPRTSVHSIEDHTSFRSLDSPDAPQDVSSLVDPESEFESTGGREVVDLPVFHLIDVDDNHADLDDMLDVDEDDTKKSFDFTGELEKLNESGGSDRASFVEQLEKAFKTPAKIDLRYDFGGQGSLLQVDIPPLPVLPSMIAMDSSKSVELTSSSISSQEAHYGGSTQATSSSLEIFPISRLLDAKEPTLLPGSDSISSTDSQDLPDTFAPKVLESSVSSASRPSDGELNKSFKFGGFTKSLSQEVELEKPISFSDIIPSPSRVRALSNASSFVDDSVINSIIAKASEVPAARPQLNSSTGKRNARDNSINAITRNITYRHSRHDSTNSFNGFDSFEEVRRGFEFHDYRPSFYPPPVSNSTGSRRNNHSKQDSMMSFASISSYGHVVNAGVPDPFDYGLPSLRERPSSEEMTSTSFSMSIDDTFSFLKHAPPRKRVESDASSFYFNASGPSSKGHCRRESNMSVVSQGPPISLYNRSFGHRRNDSSTSVSSMAHSYVIHGANGGRAAWAHHRQDASIDSVDSQFSARQLGRPGIGDKMFDTAANFGAPLTSISASPPGSSYSQSCSSFDSIMDDEPRSSVDDSLFDKTGHRTSLCSESVFGYDGSSRYAQGHLLPQNAFRPVSYLSINSIHSPSKDDDTMISMIGGGHVRRRSVGSVIEASPIVRAVGHLGKRKHVAFGSVKDGSDKGHVRIIEKASIDSTSSKFGGERMIRATKGLLERQSLEESCLIAEGEDLSASYSVPVFTRPSPTTRSRSSTCTSSSSGVDTPPLSASDGSSISGGSQSSIDLAQINRILANATHPISNIALQRDRARARGEGHRRRISQARMSRSSVYETIEEEIYSPGDTPLSQSTASRKSSPTAIQPVFIVDPADNASIHSMDSWDEERGIVALRRYHELRSEAEYTVSESRRLWVDTPFSIYALQNFDPPRHPSGMQALLASSVESYGPLPMDLRVRRKRTSSRPSPYPQGRSVRVSLSPDYPRPVFFKETSPRIYNATHNPPLKEVTAHPNIVLNSPDAVPLVSKKVFHRETNPREQIMQRQENVRPRVPSTTRRTALGWSKRSAKVSSELKENNSALGQGIGMTPGNNSLRLSRPRPRGRPTPARPAVRV